MTMRMSTRLALDEVDGFALFGAEAALAVLQCEVVAEGRVIVGHRLVVFGNFLAGRDGERCHLCFVVKGEKFIHLMTQR